MLTVNGAFDLASGLLNVNITAGGITTAILQQDPNNANNFYLEADGVAGLTGTEVSGAKSSLTTISVRGNDGIGVAIGQFNWIDTNGTYNLQSIVIANLESVQFQTRATIAQASTISVSNSIDLLAGNQLGFNNNLTLTASGTNSQILSGPNAILNVANLATLTASTIDLGNANGDTLNFGSLAFSSTGNVQISENSSMNLNSSTASGDVNLQTIGDFTVDFLSGTTISILATGNILDGDAPDPAVFNADIDAKETVSLTSTDGSIGSRINNIFTADSTSNNPNPLEIIAPGNSTVSLSAANGMIALDASNLNNVATPDTNTLWIQSNTDLDAADQNIIPLIAGVDNLALIADFDRNGSGSLTLPNTISVSGDLRLSGVDVVVNPVDGAIDANANRLMFFSGQSETLRINVSQLDAQSASNLTILEANGLQLVDLNNDPSNRAVQAAGDLIIQLSNGNLSVLDSVNASGNILLQTDSANSDITIRAPVSSVNGAITLLAQRNITQDAAGNLSITTGNDSETNTIFASAITGSITMNANTSSITQGGNILYRAGDDVALGLLDAGNGSVAVNAQNNISDNNDGSTINTLNIRGSNVQLIATDGRIGNSDVLNGNPNNNVAAIDVQAVTLAARSATGIYLRESNAGVTIDRIDSVIVRQTLTDASNTSDSTSPLEDLSTTNNGPIKLQSVGGDIVINAGEPSTEGIRADGSGDILLQTLNSGTIITNADVLSGSGNITLNAFDALTLQDRLKTSAPGTLFITSAANVSVSNFNSNNVHLSIQSGNDIFLGSINAGTANVFLDAAGNIQDSDPASNSVNVAAAALGMQAGGKIGDADPSAASNTNRNAIGTQVATLSARAASGIYIQEANAVTIASVSVVANQVNFNSTLTDRSRVLEDLSTTNDGPILLQSLGGNIVVNAGPANAPGINANGSGHILLQTLNTGNITLNGDVISGSGNISVNSAAAINQNSSIATTGGSVDVAAISDITMSSGAQTISTGGNVLLKAGGNIQLGLVDAATGKVSISAGASITDANGAALNVVADALRIEAKIGSIGGPDATNGTPNANANAIDTRVVTLAAQSVSGIYIQETDGVTIDNTGDITVSRVNFNSTLSSITDASLEDLTTTNNGPIKLQSIAGDIVVNAGAAATPGINANGSGDILLQTLNNGTIQVNALVQSGSGDISVKSADDFALNNNYRTTAPGSFFFSSGRDISWAAGVPTLDTTGLNILLVAGRDILLGEINANGTGDVGLIAQGDILDANDGALVNNRNIFARNLILIADSDNNGSGTIGTADPGSPTPDTNANAIDTQVDVLAARSATGIYVREQINGLVIDSSTVAVRDVNFNSTNPAADVTLEDLSTTNNGSIKLQSLGGDIVVNAGTATTLGINANGSGDILLQTLNTGNVTLNGGLVSGSGNISVNSIAAINQNGNIATTGGSVDVASISDITMSSGAQT
ncbi:MAG: beta strand repeat-containing protein, partial [Pirellula sp.]